MNLGIKGLRFFRNLYPTLPERIPNGYRIEKYPRDFAYSWTVYGEKDKNFLMEDFMPWFVYVSVNCNVNILNLQESFDKSILKFNHFIVISKCSEKYLVIQLW